MFEHEIISKLTKYWVNALVTLSPMPTIVMWQLMDNLLHFIQEGNINVG
jgi:hypothetical protein